MVELGFLMADNGSGRGNLTGILRTSLAPVTMVYDKENREIASMQGETVVSYTYSGDGLKRSEFDAKTRTTIIWDGSEYLGEVEDEA